MSECMHAWMDTAMEGWKSGRWIPARSEKVAPSMAALYSRPGRMLPGLSPVITPEEWGQLGVRSPVM